MMANKALAAFYYPEGIAVIGASRNPGKAGYQVVKNLTQGSYNGPVYPVNPAVGDVLGHKCYPSLGSIEGRVSLIIITTPADQVVDIFREAARRGDVRAAIVVSAGFSETKDPAKIAMEKEFLALAGQAGIRILGPNCTGVINTANGLDTTIEPTVAQTRGGISIYSQSGAMGGSILLFMEDQPVPLGFNKWTHSGNTCDLDVIDVLEYYGADPGTETILLYTEAINKGRQFMELARQIAPRKTILVLKVGRTELGVKAAYSHTGALAGSNQVYEAAFRKCGVLRMLNLEEMVDTAKALAMQPLPRGNRICILTEAGGPGTIAMDELGTSPLVTLAEISPAGQQRLHGVVPPISIVCQPQGYIDITAAAMEEHHARALQCVLEEDGVDGVILLSVPPTYLKPESLAGAIIEAVRGYNKPVLTCLLAGQWVREARRMLEAAGLPTYATPDRAARAMINMVQRQEYLRGLEVK
ncbi:MAG: hypothetical protein PWQ18_164 [Clostridia bacterium]|nr:hypothetical protein [Clostridia bacterium]